jgi:hypothetical protein
VQAFPQGKVVVVPFGDAFLLNTADKILQLSQAGEVLKTYAVPQMWIERDYQVMQYRK